MSTWASETSSSASSSSLSLSLSLPYEPFDARARAPAPAPDDPSLVSRWARSSAPSAAASVSSRSFLTMSLGTGAC